MEICVILQNNCKKCFITAGFFFFLIVSDQDKLHIALNSFVHSQTILTMLKIINTFFTVFRFKTVCECSTSLFFKIGECWLHLGVMLLYKLNYFRFFVNVISIGTRGWGYMSQLNKNIKCISKMKRVIKKKRLYKFVFFVFLACNTE